MVARLYGSYQNSTNARDIGEPDFGAARAEMFQQFA
jgi:hypothetical protein